MCTNLNGWFSKRFHLQRYLSIIKFDIVCLTETKLSSDILDESLLCNIDYNFIRNDRNRHGGGVAILIRKNLSISIPAFHTNFISEAVCVEIHSKNISFLVFVAYRPPGDILGFRNIISDLLSIPSQYNIIVCGDFNAPHVDWRFLTSSNHHEQCFAVDTAGLGLRQVVSDYTRYNPPHILDLVFTNADNFLYYKHVDAPIANSDHGCVICHISSEPPPISSKKIRDFVNCDNISISHELIKCNWFSNFWLNNLNPQLDLCSNFVNSFMNIINHLINKYVPYKTLPSNGIPWPQYIVDLDNQRTAAFKDFTRNFDLFSKCEFDRLTTLVKNLQNSFLIRYEKHIISDNSRKRFFKYISKYKRQTNNIPDLTDANGATVSSALSKAILLNSQFVSNCTVDNGRSPFCHPYYVRYSVIQPNFSPPEVYKELCKMPNSYTTGPDGIPTLFLRKFACELAEPLSFLYEFSYNLSCVPQIWRDATVIPLYKKRVLKMIHLTTEISHLCPPLLNLLKE